MMPSPETFLGVLKEVSAGLAPGGALLLRYSDDKANIVELMQQAGLVVDSELNQR